VKNITIIALAVMMAACAHTAPEHVGVSTSSAPAVPWTPPDDVAKTTATPAKPTVIPADLPHELKLEDVLAVALQNNPRTRESWLRAKAAEAALGSERGDYFPQLDLTGSVALTRVENKDGDAVSQTTFGPNLILTYLLFDSGGRAARVEQARQTLIATDFEHNQVIQDVILRVQQAYYQYLDAKALLDAQSSTLKERQASLDAAEARHNAGVSTIADVLQARTALSQAKLTYDTIAGQMRTIEGELATAMGVRPTSDFSLGVLPAVDTTDAVSAAIEELIQRAQTERPELAAARAEAERARAHIKEVRAEGLPQITAAASTGATFFGASGNPAEPYSAIIGIRFPLFTGWRNTYDIREAQYNAQLAQEEVIDLQQQVALDVWTSYFAVQTAKQRLATTRDLLASAQQSADVARARYREGVGTIVDVLTAEAALESARAQEVQSRTDWFLSLAQLAHDTGRLGT
jgi:outer membrane protein